MAAVLEQAKVVLAEAQSAGQPGGVKPLSVPYAEAGFEVPRHTAPHELSAREMAEIIQRIVALEGPIHEDEVTPGYAGRGA